MSTRSGKTYNSFHIGQEKGWAALGARQLTKSILDELVDEEENIVNVNGDPQNNMATKDEIADLLKKWTIGRYLRSNQPHSQARNMSRRRILWRSLRVMRSYLI